VTKRARDRRLATRCPGCGAEGSFVSVQVCTTPITYVYADFGPCVDIGGDRYRIENRCIHCALALDNDGVEAAAVAYGKELL
jgi:hypothetical protein